MEDIDITFDITTNNNQQSKSKSKIEEKFKIANFNLENIRKERSPQNSEFWKQCQYSWEAFIELEWRRSIILRNAMIVSLYLVFHFVIQSLYQYDRMCPKHLWNDDKDDRETCKIWAKTWFKRWNELMNGMARVITFLVGFYVATNMRRWWEQIKSIPKATNIGIQLENIMDKISPEEALNLKKKILRYLHLSWTLVMTQIGIGICDEFSAKNSYISKGLLTVVEEQYLKTQIEQCNGSYQTLWFVPINWAVLLLKKGWDQKKFKDPKEILKSFMTFQNNLRYILDHKDYRMPVIFSAAVRLAVIGWIGVTLIGAQNTQHYTDDEARVNSAAGLILLTVPGHELFIIILILTWLQAADKLINAFGRDKGYDVNLVVELDDSLWMNSQLLQQQYLATSEKEERLGFLEM